MAIQQEIEAVYEDIYDALRAAVQMLGGAKKVAERLWPTKAPARRASELTDALNRNNDRKLDPEETMRILQWAREIGFHGAKHFIDNQTGYEYSKPISVEREKADLQTRFMQSVKDQQKMLARIEHLSQFAD